MRNNTEKLEYTQLTDFGEDQGRKYIIAFFLGILIVGASIFLGKSYIFYISFLSFSLFITFLWRKNYHPWIAIVMISAATPIYITKKMFPCNLIFAFWFAVLNREKIAELPKFIKISVFLIAVGFLTSSLNWMDGDIVNSVARQATFLYNMFLGPLLFLPLAFLKMKDSRDHEAKLRGLLFCLILPSTLILISAKFFGTVANEWEASLRPGLAAGYLQYQLGRVIIDLTRTGVGFILAALICASTPILISQVKGRYRWIAGACLGANIYLLLSTGSFGSIAACLCGLFTIYFDQIRRVRIAKLFLSLAAFCFIILLVYNFAPDSTKEYLGQRYEHRVVEKDTDRVTLWTRAIEYFFKNPEGVGFTLSVGGRSNPHNDYISYAISYGFIGGFAYPVLIISLLIYWYKNRKMIIKDNNALAVNLAGQGVIVAFSLNSMTDNILAIRWYFNVIWSLIWYCYFCSKTTRMASIRE